MSDYKNEVINYLASLSKEELSKLIDEAVEAVEKKNGKFIPITIWANEPGRKQMNEESRKSLENELDN